MNPSTTRRRELLERWIADSRRTQRTMVKAGAAGVAAGALIGVAADGTAGLLVMAVAAALAVVSAWVTYAHIADWRQQREHLERTGRVR